ncbi:hypothetical protein O181_086300 [Austropuccinia psidii MF-1]|uniref:Uncharacterized protein n=1 Tax=Austropuccinia psidii MF-1 TaxID=1389203 RepID=A0A9Q3FTY8_9BASI|nr:hypothetical protein [Austropuccinia psidii MF-1]
MGQLTQAVSQSDNSRDPAFKPPYMKAPGFFGGIQAHKLRGFTHSCELIFNNDPESFFSYRKKVLYSLVELETGFDHISQLSPMRTNPIS